MQEKMEFAMGAITVIVLIALGAMLSFNMAQEPKVQCQNGYTRAEDNTCVPNSFYAQ